MRPKFIAILLLLFASAPCHAVAAFSYQSALITGMRMVQCQEPPRRGGIVSDILIGSAPPNAMGSSECPEYEIEGATVFYRIRPRKDVLLPVGETIRFRLHKRDMLILTDDANKELVFSVVEMSLRSKRHPQVEASMKASDGSPRKCLTMEGEVVRCGEK